MLKKKLQAKLGLGRFYARLKGSQIDPQNGKWSQGIFQAEVHPPTLRAIHPEYHAGHSQVGGSLRVMMSKWLFRTFQSPLSMGQRGTLPHSWAPHWTVPCTVGKLSLWWPNTRCRYLGVALFFQSGPPSYVQWAAHRLGLKTPELPESPDQPHPQIQVLISKRKEWASGVWGCFLASRNKVY